MRNIDKRLLLLGLLRNQKMHGYQLQQFLDQHTEFLCSLKTSTAYYTLERMADEGLVEARSERSGRRPMRQVYYITQRGEELFRRLLAQNLSAYDLGESAGDIGVAFLNAIPSEELVGLLAAKREETRRRLEEVESSLARVADVDPPHLPLLRARLRIHADLEWIEIVERAATSRRPDSRSRPLPVRPEGG